MASLPESLGEALEEALAGIPAAGLARSVSFLTDRYRSGQPASSPILTSAADVAAYAAYRMPATYAACRAALSQFRALAADFRPRTQVDVGGGTGAAVWAAAEIWPSLEAIEVLERVPRVIELGGWRRPHRPRRCGRRRGARSSSARHRLSRPRTWPPCPTCWASCRRLTGKAWCGNWLRARRSSRWWNPAPRPDTPAC